MYLSLNAKNYQNLLSASRPIQDLALDLNSSEKHKKYDNKVQKVGVYVLTRVAARGCVVLKVPANFLDIGVHTLVGLGKALAAPVAWGIRGIAHLAHKDLHENNALRVITFEQSALHFAHAIIFFVDVLATPAVIINPNVSPAKIIRDLTKEIDEYRELPAGQLAEAQTVLAKKQRILDQAVVKCSEADNKLRGAGVGSNKEKRAQKALNRAAASVINARQERDDARFQVQQLSGALQEPIQNVLDATRQQLEEVQNALARSRDNARAYGLEVERNQYPLLQDLRRAQEQLDYMRGQYDASQQRLRDAEAQVAELQNARAPSEERLRQAQADLDVCQSDLLKAQGRIHDAENRDKQAPSD